MESYIHDDDIKRCFRDKRTIGSLSKEVPIQSTFALLIDSFKLDENLNKVDAFPLVKSSSRQPSNSALISTPINSKELSDSVLQLLKPRCKPSQSFQSKFDHLVSISDPIPTSNLISNPTNFLGVVDLTNKIIPVNVNVNPTSYRKQGLKEVNSCSTFDSSFSTTSIQPIAKKRNPFETAKTQFVKEGGKLDSVAQSTMKAKKPDGNTTSQDSDGKEDLPPELQQYERHLIEKIESDIIHTGQPILFRDVAGLDFAKRTVQEIIVWPMTRPDLFKGLRAVPKGLLLFGPPGTGKTLIGKAISYEIGATFFSISASSLTSKWIGEGEKTVRTLFGIAAYRQPSVIFIDEIDSLLCQRSSDENEASRRMKTEFLVQIDGASTSSDARVVLIGATNRPDELDDAARRRFVKRLYIPLPDSPGRRQLFDTLLHGNHHSLQAADVIDLVDRTAGYSGADIRSLCTEAAMGPVRDLAQSGKSLHSIRDVDVPPIQRLHFELAFDSVVPSVSTSDLKKYLDWNNEYGSFRKME